MSTPAERQERKRHKPEPLFIRQMEAELVRLRARVAEQDRILRALLAERPSWRVEEPRA